MTDVLGSYPDEISEALKLLKAGKRVEAEQIAQSYVQAHPGSAQGHAALGDILIEQSKFHEAVQVLSTALALDPQARNCYGQLARALAALNNHQQAAMVYEAQAKRWPDEPSTHFARANALAACFDGEGAAAAAKHAVSLSPPGFENLLRLARVYVNTGRTADAIETYGAVLKLNPALPFIAFMLSELLAAIGRRKEADIVYRRGVSVMVPSVSSIHEWVVHLDTRGMRKEAFDLCQKLLAMNPDDVAALTFAASHLAGWARYEEAASYLQKAKALSPDNVVMNEVAANFALSMGTYLPRVRRLAEVPPGPRRNVGDDVIVVRGGLDELLVDVVRSTRAAHPGVFLILSTWEDTPASVLEAVRDYVDDVVLNARPPTSGVNNINYQVVCAANGIDRAIALGAVRVLLTRTDIALLRDGLMGDLRRELESYDSSSAQKFGLKGRLLISDMYTSLPYHFSDMFMYGYAADVQKYWSLESMSDACFRPEITLCREFANRIGWQLGNSFPDGFKLLMKLFIVRGTPWFRFFWHRKPCYLTPCYLAYVSHVTEAFWMANHARDAPVASAP